MNKLNIFKWEHFDRIAKTNFPAKELADMTNEILNKFIEENCVKVYGDSKDAKITFWCTQNEREYNTHVAYLINVQEIKKECKHEPERTKFFDIEVVSSQCKNCGVKLKAEWKEVD